MLHPAALKIHSIQVMKGGEKRLISFFCLGGVQYEHGEWREVVPSNWCRVEFTVKLYLTCFHYLLVSVAMANCWATGNDKCRALHLAPPKSSIWLTAYPEGCTCFLRVRSWWCLPLSTSHTEHDYNTVCHWLDMAIVVHTPVTLTLREKRWAALASPGPPHRPSRPSALTPPPVCPRGASVSQKPLQNHRRTPGLIVSFQTPKM